MGIFVLKNNIFTHFRAFFVIISLKMSQNIKKYNLTIFKKRIFANFFMATYEKTLIMDKENYLSQNISNFRKQLGYTQEAISKYLGISQPAYNKYETGETNIPIEAIEKLASLFHVEEYDLMEENPEILQTSIACAFRADNINASDLTAIAAFQKIVKNYIMMCNELENAN